MSVLWQGNGRRGGTKQVYDLFYGYAAQVFKPAKGAGCEIDDEGGRKGTFFPAYLLYCIPLRRLPEGDC